MGTTPAAELARIKLQHPVWLIRPDGDSRFIARRLLANGHLQQVRARTLGALEHELWIREKFCDPHHDGRSQGSHNGERPAAPA